jgi:hypothetical protein
MKHNICLAILVLLLAGTTFAEKSQEITEVGKPNFEANFPSGGRLRMHIRSGDVTVRGTDDAKIRVHYDGTAADDIKDVRVNLKTDGTYGDLHISGGPHNHFEIIVEIPKQSDLWLRVFAGDVTVQDLVGSKDVELWAGDLVIDAGNPEDYAHAEASVRAGDLETGRFGGEKSGMFRSFEKSGNGKYRLHAHTTFGDVTLR